MVSYDEHLKLVRDMVSTPHRLIDARQVQPALKAVLARLDFLERIVDKVADATGTPMHPAEN